MANRIGLEEWEDKRGLDNKTEFRAELEKSGGGKKRGRKSAAALQSVAPTMVKDDKSATPIDCYLPVKSIKIGERFRKDLGDIEALKTSIARSGLLHPIVVNLEDRLIAGRRRLEACEQLGWSTVPVRRVDIDSIVRGEFDENTFRKNFTLREADAIAAEVEKIERPLAKARERAGVKAAEAAPGEEVTFGQKGKTREKVAKAVGRGARSIEKAREVFEAERADPETFGPIAEEMNSTGKVDRAYKQMRMTRDRAEYDKTAQEGTKAIADLDALAQTAPSYKALLVDPPWDFQTYSPKGKAKSAEQHYPVMSLADIKAMPVAQLAGEDCALFLCAVWPHLTQALEVIEAWGFEYKTLAFIWVKQNEDGEGLHTGMGYWTRSNTEPVLFATRGKPTRLAMDVHQVILSPVGKHSAKPEELPERIERLVPGPYLELFAREKRDGWTSWGNEIGCDDEDEAADGPVSELEKELAEDLAEWNE
jgi:N6-adenosine-specific RNA methylase IME4